VKAVITATAPTPEAPIDPRFGRAAHLILFDTKTRTFTPLNGATDPNAVQGAGIQAAQAVADSGAAALVTGNCGPKAFRALNAAGVTIYLAADMTVAEAAERLADGRLQPAQGATVPAHGG
jgi:predicted Fe-Mo cluster-binding NifX family protein